MPFQSLPAEVLQDVATYLPSLHDRCTLSVLSRHTRAAVTPLLFRGIRFTNLAIDSAAIDAAVATRGSHAEHLQFDFFLFPNRPDDGDEGDDADDSDNESARSRLPVTELRPEPRSRSFAARRSLTCLRSRWRSGPTTTCRRATGAAAFYGDVGSIHICEVLEDVDQAPSREERYHWRRAASDAWRALAANGAVRALDVRSLPPKNATSWGTEGWRAFAGRLERLSIGLWGDRIQEWRLNDMEGYEEFVSGDLVWHFFTAAEELRALRIETFVAAMPSAAGAGGGELNVDMGLVEFMAAHAEVLERVKLTNCRATWKSRWREDACTWARFFSHVADSRATALVELSVQNDVAPPAEPDNIKEIRKQLKANRALRLFYYAGHDEDSTWANTEAIAQSFENGADQATYDQVQALVNANRMRVSSRKLHG
ncbi:hypothetical protein DFJ73DRAFT_776904 [Zopfochytrium polystomum]|nr:hypothetical protein DFJ73DRAFT_776904 [Zopfochytrium polystomum]